MNLLIFYQYNVLFSKIFNGIYYMSINALSYIGVNSDKIEDWQDFATKNLGMQITDHSKKSLSFRMDDQKQRFTVSGEPGDKLAFLGWEIRSSKICEKVGR